MYVRVNGLCLEAGLSMYTWQLDDLFVMSQTVDDRYPSGQP